MPFFLIGCGCVALYYCYCCYTGRSFLSLYDFSGLGLFFDLFFLNTLNLPVVLKLGRAMLEGLNVFGLKIWKVSSGWKVAKRLASWGSSLCAPRLSPLKLFEIGDFDLAFFAAGVAIFCLNGFFCTDLACLFFYPYTCILCGPLISVELFYEF